MNCPKCEERMKATGLNKNYHDRDTIIFTEYYWCPNCKKEHERIATYELQKEKWE